jgi:hypothetical protein
MYRSIWQFHTYVDPTYWDKQPLVEWAFERILRFPNDELLSVELAQEPRGPYHHLVEDLEEEFAPKLLPTIVGRVDEQFASTRMRLGAAEEINDTLKRIIREVTAHVAKQDAQLELPGINDGDEI